MSARYDIAVVGGGHNGLVCAAFLAKAGRRVIVLEAAGELGGAARNATIAPGYTVPALAHVLHLLHPKVRRDLDLKKHGLRLAARNLPTVALGAGGNRTIVGGMVDGPDAAAWKTLHRRLVRLAGALRPFLGRVPPRLGTADWGDRLELARLGLSLRRLGARDMREFLRIVNSNVFDLLGDELSDDVLKGALAFDAVLGSNFGPRSPGSVLTWLYRLAGETGQGDGLAIPQGGMAAVARALEGACTAAGVTIRTGARVRRILIEDDRTSGVELNSGETIAAGAVVSGADPRTTFLNLVDAAHLDTGFIRRIRGIRSNGLAAKVNLALDGLPDFTGLDKAALGGRIVIAPDMAHIERAFDHSKYGEYSAEPAVEITIPTIHDPGLAPAGGHVLSAVVQYAPANLKGGWDAARDAFGDLVVRTIEAHAPGLSSRIVARQVLTPVDIERDFGIAGGHWHHGDLAVDRMFMLRPVQGFAQYETPVPGLYLCGAGAHPGGGVMGAAGMNAAGRILAKEKSA